MTRPVLFSVVSLAVFVACTPPSHVEPSSAAASSGASPAASSAAWPHPPENQSQLGVGTAAAASVPSQAFSSPVASHPSNALPVASSASNALPVASSASGAPPVASSSTLSQTQSAEVSDQVAEPRLLDDDGNLLPQTKDKPSTDSKLYAHHVQLLFKAIVQDDPEVARPFFFPLVAYEKVKGIAKPARDWRHRLWAHFVRDVHNYHRKLGAHPENAKLERIDFRSRRMKWMKPGSEGNRIGYYRITHTRIVGRRGDGKKLSLELTAMISWRGEWYVVHLDGFK